MPLWAQEAFCAILFNIHRIFTARHFRASGSQITYALQGPVGRKAWTDVPKVLINLYD